MEFYGGYLLAGLHFAFPLDDPYIHLSIGRNLAYHGSWGPMTDVFNSASSSILYTLIIAAFYFIGFGGISTLFIINIVSSLGCLFAFEKIVRAMKLDSDKYVVVAFSFVILVPLYHIAYLSMEHTLHIWITLIAVLKAAEYFAENKDSLKSVIILSLFTSLSILARYESLFLGLIIGLILLYRKQFLNAIIFGVIALFPVAVFGYISVMNGEHWLPNSVLVKSVKSGDGFTFYFKYLGRWGKKVFEFPQYGFGFALVITTLIWNIRLKNKDLMFWFTLIVAMLFILHGSFAEIGWLGRYEAYLVALSLVSFIFIVQKLELMGKWKYMIYIIIALFFVVRTIPYTFNYRYAMSNIYDQQIQMSRFINEYYNHSEIVINDIGAISYYTDAKYLDLWSLASTDITNFVLKYGKLDKDIVYELAEKRESKIAVIYSESSFNYVPDEWKKIASWTIENRQAPNYSTVYFYTINVSDAQLLDQIIEFSKSLPDNVKVKYYMPIPLTTF